jgi:hypothetical protein
MSLTTSSVGTVVTLVTKPIFVRHDQGHPDTWQDITSIAIPPERDRSKT